MLSQTEIKELKLKYKNIYRFIINNHEYIVKKPNVNDCYNIEYAINTEVEQAVLNALLNLVVYPDTVLNTDKNILIEKISDITYFFKKENFEKLEEKTKPDKSSRIIQSKLLCMRAFSQFKYEDFSNMEIEELFTIANIAKMILENKTEDNTTMKYDTNSLVENESDPNRKAAILSAEQQRQRLVKEVANRKRFRKLT